VQQYSVLTFSYASGIGTFEVKYVRVRKPDGSVVETPADNVQDMAAQITREAPFYSDLHEKHIAVKGLGVGDILEFQIAESTTKPLAPGQFWTSYEFTHGQIVLDEQLQISVPRERSIKLKSSMVQPIISEAGDYRVYVWHSSNLQHKDETEKKREGAISRAAVCLPVAGARSDAAQRKETTTCECLNISRTHLCTFPGKRQACPLLAAILPGA